MIQLEEMTKEQLIDELRHSEKWRISADQELAIATARCGIVRKQLKERFSVSV